MADHELLLSLLPSEGDWISRDAAWTALSERLGRDIEQEAFDALVFQLGSKVAWEPHERLLCRRLEAISSLPTQIGAESDLEPWFERFIWKNASRLFYDPTPRSLSIVVQNTARGGRPTGRWTRPDICMACISRYNYSAIPQFDLYSFELKMPSGCNMLAVHEALSHSAWAHFAYLAVYLPNSSKEVSLLPAMLEQAQRHGVGLIQFSDPEDESTYSLLLAAQRNSPAPAKIDGFIDDRFDEANRLALRRWVRI